MIGGVIAGVIGGGNPRNLLQFDLGEIQPPPPGSG